MSVNKVTLLGRLGGDPELKYTPSGMAVCNFTVATSEAWVDKSGQKQERTEWHRVVVWGKLGELCNQYLAKGRQAYIEGSLQTRSWEDKNGQKRYVTEIMASTVQFLGGNANASNKEEGNSKPEKNTSNRETKNSQSRSQNNDPGPSDGDFKEYDISSDTNFTADDIPF